MLAAQKLAMKVAGTTPNTESLFSPTSDCFSGISRIVDLSFAIPDLAGLAQAALNAVKQYAQKKICSAVREATSAVTKPLNDLIGTVNSVGNADMNDIFGNVIEDGLKDIDPELAASFNPPPNPDENKVFDANVSFDVGLSGVRASGTVTTPASSTASGDVPKQSEPAAQASQQSGASSTSGCTQTALGCIQ